MYRSRKRIEPEGERKMMMELEKQERKRNTRTRKESLEDSLDVLLFRFCEEPFYEEKSFLFLQ